MRSKDPALMNKIIDFIDEYYAKNFIIPTMQTIGDSLNISKACVSNYIAEMKEKGLIENKRGWYGIRTKNISKINNNAMLIPVVGTIACGTPLLAEENIEEYLPIPKSFIGNGEYFILKANGNSMIKAGIEDGDLVIVRQQESAEQGQIVVALIDDEATLKRYYLDNKKKQVRLHPENDEMQDMYFKKIIIQGVAVKIIKDLL